jgi:hypothetical protein
MSPVFENQISKGNKLFFFYKKSGNWEGVSSGGERYRCTLMYALSPAEPLGSFGTVNVNPPDGITSAFFDWTQTAAAISLSDMEEFKTNGSESVKSILKARSMQALAGVEDLFAKALLQGQGAIDGTSITTARYNAADGASFILPLPLLIAYDPTTSTTIGGVNQSTNSWWQNQTTASTATTLAGYLHELDTMWVKCGRGGGGGNANPDFLVGDEQSFLSYKKALRLIARLPDYKKGDIPFENVEFHGQPFMPDELVPDVYTGSTTVTAGSVFFCNSAYMGVVYDRKANFSTGSSVRPENQLASTALLTWRGTQWVSNRRKLGVVGNIAISTLATATT